MNPEGPGKEEPAEKGDKDAKAKKDDGKQPPIARPAQGEEEQKKLVKRVLRNMRDAESRLAKNDPGKVTRKIQRDILQDLDALIRQTRQRPPSQSNSRRQQRNQKNSRNSQNSKNSKNSKNSRNGQSGSNSKDPRQASDRSTQPNKGNPGKTNQGNVGGTSGKKDDRNADLFKNTWGHLTEKERQKIDEYTRAGNIPDYESLQQEYERTLAEEGNSKKGD
jgi:hypothetical protein